VVGDFDGDGDDDIGAMASSGTWTGYRSSGSEFVTEGWGQHKGKPWQHFIVGNFDGDAADEIVAFHPPSSTWWMSNLTPAGWKHSVYAKYITASGWQIHLAADKDGDGRAEILSFHPSNGTWWSTGVGETSRLVINLNTNSGWSNHAAVDVDGDGVDELVQYHSSNGTWWKIEPSPAPATVSLWTTFKTKGGWEHPTPLDAEDALVVRHRGTGNVYAIIGGAGTLDYLGRMLPGELEGFWAGPLDDTSVLIALQRD
jgi:hypothetical protein